MAQDVHSFFAAELDAFQGASACQGAIQIDDNTVELRRHGGVFQFLGLVEHLTCKCSVGKLQGLTGNLYR